MPTAFNPYIPVNYSRLKAQHYCGYSDIPPLPQSSSTGDSIKPAPLFPLQLITHLPPSIGSPAVPPSSAPSQPHFDRVLMPVSIRQTLAITDMQAGALLGPKGERIQQLQRETGAIVNISDVNDENGERRKRLVNVQGSQQQVQNAFQTIRKLLMISNSDDDEGEESTKRKDGGRMKRL